jgi:pre-mRNA-splicing factor 38A
MQNLVENIVRQKIYQTMYWKESCFALTAESLIDKAVDLRSVGGTHGGAKMPTNFLCLILKMLQIQPAKEIIIEYIKNEDFKYVRLLGLQQQHDCMHASMQIPFASCIED